MKSEDGTYKTLIVAMLLGVAGFTADAAEVPQTKGAMPGAVADFNSADGDKDGYLSMEEFKKIGKDDLAFRAADIDGDARIDPVEYDKYLKAQAVDGPKSDGVQRPKPADPVPMLAPAPRSSY